MFDAVHTSYIYTYTTSHTNHLQEHFRISTLCFSFVELLRSSVQKYHSTHHHCYNPNNKQHYLVVPAWLIAQESTLIRLNVAFDVVIRQKSLTFKQEDEEQWGIVNTVEGVRVTVAEHDET